MKKAHANRFDMTDMSEVNHIPSILAPRDYNKRALTISKADYLPKVFKRLVLRESDTVNTRG